MHKFVKWVCVNRPNEATKISFGSTSQLRTAVIQAGERKCYFVDIPRTKGSEDKIENLLSVIEDMKVGFLTSNMYGKHTSLIMDPPHVVIFSNDPCPRQMMSEDRWKSFKIDLNKRLI